VSILKCLPVGIGHKSHRFTRWMKPRTGFCLFHSFAPWKRYVLIGYSFRRSQFYYCCPHRKFQTLLKAVVTDPSKGATNSSRELLYTIKATKLNTYVPLHVHSEYSLLDGASHIRDLVQRAKSLSCPALALTDHGVMFGIVELIEECMKNGIKPIAGNEV